ncbi:CLUMA_CG013816, isoform A [Clunio marinus]|uniref:CLUMA_CG013816, isoform A n=1 Tax=Clunio marinus TaxID=568069 RepID=A0A1J1ILW5_9DIPT|nr:CLUMA_CG013816, isoform A [Clunio marinus]
MIAQSCSKVQKYQTALMDMQVYVESLQVSQQRFDICSKKKKPDLINLTLQGWGIPQKCPFNNETIFCNNSTSLLSNETKRIMIFLASTMKNAFFKILIVHDTGTSCFEGEGKIRNNKLYNHFQTVNEDSKLRKHAGNPNDWALVKLYKT